MFIMVTQKFLKIGYTEFLLQCILVSNFAQLIRSDMYSRSRQRAARCLEKITKIFNHFIDCNHS